MSKTQDDEPALLMAECGEGKMLLNEENIAPKMTPGVENKPGDSNVWYLDNGASNDMTGYRSKFMDLVTVQP